MNGVHDLGGMEGLGRLPINPDEAVFSADWERTAFSMTIATLATGYFHVDEVRSLIEQMDPADYLAATYYQKWSWALCEMMKNKGVVTEEEIEAGKSLQKGFELPPIPLEGIKGGMVSRMRADVETDAKPAFAEGDVVLAKNMHPHNHTRIPRYVRGKPGRILQVHEAYRLPDENAHGNHDVIEYCYTVQFNARDVWGEDAPEKDSIMLTMFESYMEPLE